METKNGTVIVTYEDTKKFDKAFNVYAKDDKLREIAAALLKTELGHERFLGLDGEWYTVKRNETKFLTECLSRTIGTQRAINIASNINAVLAAEGV